MDALKQILGTLGAVIGVLSGLVTLYAKYADIKKKAGLEGDAAQPQPALIPPPRHGRPAEFGEPPTVLEVIAPASVADARRLVKAPAIALMALGGVSFLFNLVTAGYGYVDEFVTPLSNETQVRHAAEAARMANPWVAPTSLGVPSGGDSDRASTVMGVAALLSFSIASAAAVWAGYNMLRLRSYWLSMAGSVAIMPGACVCCMAGFPVGIWSLMVLMKPEVSGSFR